MEETLAWHLRARGLNNQRVFLDEDLTVGGDFNDQF